MMPFYDRDIVGGSHTIIQFFSDPMRTSDGRPKSIRFTNLHLCSRLSLEKDYELEKIMVHPVVDGTCDLEEYADLYERFIWSDAVLRFELSSRIVIQIPLTVMPSSLWQTGLLRDDETGDSYRIVIRNGKLEIVEVSEAIPYLTSTRLQDRLITRHMSLRTPIVISTHDEFKVSILWKSSVRTPFDIYVAFEGDFAKAKPPSSGL